MMRKISRRWRSMPGNIQGSLIILVTSLVSVIMTSLIKELGRSIPVFEILFLRQLLVFLVVSPLIFRDIGGTFTTKNFGYHVLRGAFSLIAMYTGFTAVLHLPLAEVTAISFVRILFTTLLAMFFLKEMIGVRRWVSVGVGFIGVLVIVRPEAGNINLYAGYAIASALFVSGISIVMRKLSQIENPSTIIAYQSVIVVLGMSGPAIYLWVTPTPYEMSLILMVGVLMSVLQWLFIQAFKVGEAAAIAPMEYSRLIFAILIGIVFFAEIPILTTMGGACIIVASTLYTMHRNALKKRNGRQTRMSTDE